MLTHTEKTAHGFCLLWDWELIVPMVISDALIAFAYFSIPLALFLVVRRSGVAVEPILQRLLIGFTVFIFTCGLTHVMDILIVWWPLYWPSLGVRVACALSSVATAVFLWPAVFMYMPVLRSFLQQTTRPRPA